MSTLRYLCVGVGKPTACRFVSSKIYCFHISTISSYKSQFLNYILFGVVLSYLESWYLVLTDPDHVTNFTYALREKLLFPNIPKKSPMGWAESFDCLKRERDICVKIMITQQKCGIDGTSPYEAFLFVKISLQFSSFFVQNFVWTTLTLYEYTPAKLKGPCKTYLVTEKRR